LNSAPLAVLVAFAGYSLLNISQATQKIGLGLYQTDKLKGALLWSGATGCTSVSVFIVLYAVSLGSVTVVGAMAGTGLASLAVFSAFVMKEKITFREIAGIGIILGAAALIGVFSRETSPGDVDRTALFLFLGVVPSVYAAAWLVFRRKAFVGLIVGGFAGALGGLVPLFQKVSTTEVGRAASLAAARAQADPNRSPWIHKVMEILLNPYALVWIVLSIFSMLVLQFSYKSDRAIRIVPVFSSNYIVIPILGGVICFTERLHVLQWVGVSLILVGVLVLTYKRKTVAS
jgi:uncharacterized membrane protein